MTTNTKDALHQAAESLRNAEQQAETASQALDAHTAILRAQSIHARETKSKMYDSFVSLTRQSWHVYDLKHACESYDKEHLRVLNERNLCGDLLDSAAQNGCKCVPEELEYAAVRFEVAQKVLDVLQKGEPADKRKRDGRALHGAEIEYRKLKAAYEAGKANYEGESDKVQELDGKWNELRAHLMDCYSIVEECRKELRKAARAYGKEVTAQRS